LLLCKQVKRRKGKGRGGGSITIIGSGGRFNALVVLDQARVRVLEFDGVVVQSAKSGPMGERPNRRQPLLEYARCRAAGRV